MARKILAVFVILWGVAILLSFALGFTRIGGGAYGSGQAAGLVFGVLLAAAGAYALLKRPGDSR